MLDVSFWELVVIGVVALIVIGPDKLPAVARTMGYWFGKTRRFVTSVQEDFQREIAKTEELKRLLEEQAQIKEMHEIIEQTVDETRRSVSTGAPLNKPVADNSLFGNPVSDNSVASNPVSSNPVSEKPVNQFPASGPKKDTDQQSAHSATEAVATARSPSTPADQVNEQTK